MAIWNKHENLIKWDVPTNEGIADVKDILNATDDVREFDKARNAQKSGITKMARGYDTSADANDGPGSEGEASSIKDGLNATNEEGEFDRLRNAQKSGHNTISPNGQTSNNAAVSESMPSAEEQSSDKPIPTQGGYEPAKAGEQALPERNASPLEQNKPSTPAEEAPDFKADEMNAAVLGGAFLGEASSTASMEKTVNAIANAGESVIEAAYAIQKIATDGFGPLNDKKDAKGSKTEGDRATKDAKYSEDSKAPKKDEKEKVIPEDGVPTDDGKEKAEPVLDTENKALMIAGAAMLSPALGAAILLAMLVEKIAEKVKEQEETKAAETEKEAGQAANKDGKDTKEIKPREMEEALDGRDVRPVEAGKSADGRSAEFAGPDGVAVGTAPRARSNAVAAAGEKMPNPPEGVGSIDAKKSVDLGMSARANGVGEVGDQPVGEAVSPSSTPKVADLAQGMER